MGGPEDQQHPDLPSLDRALDEMAAATDRLLRSVDGLTEEDLAGPGRAQRLVLDLVALQTVPDAEAVLRYLRSIILERGDYNGRVLSIRRDDLRAICSLLRTDESATIDQLAAWGAIVDGPDPTSS